MTTPACPPLLIKIVTAFSLRNIALESVTDGQTDGRTDDGQSDPYVSLCFAGDTKTYQKKNDRNCRWGGRLSPLPLFIASQPILKIQKRV